MRWTTVNAGASAAVVAAVWRRAAVAADRNLAGGRACGSSDSGFWAASAELEDAAYSSSSTTSSTATAKIKAPGKMREVKRPQLSAMATFGVADMALWTAGLRQASGGSCRRRDATRMMGANVDWPPAEGMNSTQWSLL
jgi:hypothetical protein